MKKTKKRNDYTDSLYSAHECVLVQREIDTHVGYYRAGRRRSPAICNDMNWQTLLRSSLFYYHHGS